MNRTALLYAAAAVILLGGLFLWFRPPPQVPAPSQPAAAPAPPRRVVELVVREGRLAGGPAVIRVRQGEIVSLTVTADATDELHLHGYDLTLKLRPGEPASLVFAADRSGRFEYELHHSHSELGALEVEPR